jgi:LmbE family N-acetylglucosaminyl deacetylase
MKERLHLYLSPHFDDAIFSCGGLIHAQRSAAERVGVLTLCAGLPEPGTESTLAKQYLADWSKSGDGMMERRAENANALSSWDVRNLECSTPDAIFRTGRGASYYQERADLFCEPCSEDAKSVLPLWQEYLRQSVEGEKQIHLYAPLGIGGHVDHELTRRLGQRMLQSGWNVSFYEDYPYVELEPNGIQKAQIRFGASQWTSRSMAIDVQAKIDAIRKYRTQIGRVFGSDEDLVRRVRSFSAEVAADLRPREWQRDVLPRSWPRLRFWQPFFHRRAHAERIWLARTR